MLIDCLTLWVSNLMGEDLEEVEIEQRAEAAAGVAATRGGLTVVVSNEVGSGIVPVNEMARHVPGSPWQGQRDLGRRSRSGAAHRGRRGYPGVEDRRGRRWMR